MLKSVKAGCFSPASILSLALFLFSPVFVLAQTADASQSSAVEAAISSYTASLLHGAEATAIALEVALAANFPNAVLKSIASGFPTLLPSITSGENLYSFATNPPVTFGAPDWVQSLPAAVQSDVEGLRTSVVRAEASIAASVLGITQAAVTSTASPTPTSSAAGLWRGQRLEVVILASGLISVVVGIMAL